MLEMLPKRALFSFEMPIHRVARPPRIDGLISKWAAKYLLPPLVELEGQRPFGDFYLAWNEDGLYAAVDVPKRGSKPQCDPVHWWKKNGVRLCVDTRDARDVKRATRFCHFFYLLPTGGGRRGDAPVVGTHRMSRAKEAPPVVDVEQIRVASHVHKDGYSLEAAIPAACLHGWDPAEHARIGIYYKIKDSQLGSQHLSSDEDLGWNADPSTWATGVLV
jgi:hypothetical protein